MRQYTRDLYANVLPYETGLSCGYKEVGFIELACDVHRLAYYRRVAAFNRYCGVNVIEISPEEVKDRCPIIECTDVLAGFYVKSDGRANPTDVTMAFIKGAKMAGAHVVEGVSVSSVTTTTATETKRGGNNGNSIPKVTGVTLTTGETIHCNAVANCAGMWARQFGQRMGVTVPNQAAEHYYLLTEPINDIDPNWPIVEDSSKCLYVRPEGGGLMLGLFETQGASWNVDSIPEEGFVYGQIDPDWDRMGPYLEMAMDRVPIAKTAGVKSFFCGPESFTPDGYPIVGESCEIRNYYIAAGMNSVGILTGGGVGKILAHWIKDGRPPTDVDTTAMDATRFKTYQNNPKYRRDRSGETLGNT
jgi:4-methylaminobutanoate oxidase (formaldehyde-forming)